MCRTAFFLAVVLIVVAGNGLAQNYSPADIEDGGRTFKANCANCHGPDGDGVPGVDLGHAKFRRVSTDEDLINIIRKGIPGTPMPPSNYNEFQARTIVAYLRSMAVDARDNAATGDATLGKALFEGKGQCATCHRVKGAGSRVGPDLTEIGTMRRVVELEKAIVAPPKDLLPANRMFRGVMRDGSVITGKLLNQDTFAVQILDAKERLVSIPKANLREQAIVTASSMPSYRDKLTAQELADVVSYLASLKGQVTP